MPVTPRGSSWQAQVNHKGTRYRRNFETKNEALAWEADSKARLLRGEPVDMGGQARQSSGLPYTIQQLVDHVNETHWSLTKSGNKPALQVRSLVQILGPNTPIHKLDKAALDRARRKLVEEGCQPATVNRKVAILSKAFSEAVNMGIIQSKPKFDKYKESEGRIRRFTDAELEAALTFFERLGQQAMADYVVLSLDTGMRQGEALSARFADADHRKITVWGVGAKSGKTRTVPLTDRAKGVIERRRAAAGERANEVRILGDLDVWSVQHYWGKFREHMGMEHDKNFVPHILRHEFCSRLADAGRSAPEIMALAGHSALTVTQRYINISAANLDAAIASLNTPSMPPQPDLTALLAAVPKDQLVALLQSLTQQGEQNTQRSK